MRRNTFLTHEAQVRLFVDMSDGAIKKSSSIMMSLAEVGTMPWHRALEVMVESWAHAHATYPHLAE